MQNISAVLDELGLKWVDGYAPRRNIGAQKSIIIDLINEIWARQTTPERTTADYEQDVNPNVRAALSAALQDEEEIEMDAEENLPSMGGGQGNWMPGMEGGGRARTPPKRKPRRRKPKEDGLDAGLDALLADDSSKAPAPEAFPESRGLVRNRY